MESQRAWLAFYGASVVIFASDVKACIDVVASISFQKSAMQHYELGGFHINVMPALRKEFNQWLATRSTTNNQQLDLLGEPL